MNYRAMLFPSVQATLPQRFGNGKKARRQPREMWGAGKNVEWLSEDENLSVVLSEIRGKTRYKLERREGRSIGR
ncbi:hypothetical protein WN48_02113 [Eufriesea mexicana]|nr:hypothetical protein WN48_02113 [Eufriesea mexicana]